MHGDDPHFSFGKEQAYPGDNFNYHMIPFAEAAAWGVEEELGEILGLIEA